MSWKCPKCNAVHPYSVRKCSCGDASSSRKKTSPPTQTEGGKKRESVDLELTHEDHETTASRKQAENLEVRTIPKELRSDLNTLGEARREAATGEIAGANKQKAYLEKQAQVRELWARLKALEKGLDEKRESVEEEPKAFQPEHISEGLDQGHQSISEKQAGRKAIPVFATVGVKGMKTGPAAIVGLCILVGFLLIAAWFLFSNKEKVEPNKEPVPVSTASIPAQAPTISIPAPPPPSFDITQNDAEGYNNIPSPSKKRR